MFRKLMIEATARDCKLLRFYSNQTRSLLDDYGRVHNYLRISLTERCNLRCKYCMPEEGVQLSERDKLLDLEELKRLSNIFVKFCGINKIRFTGGEPTIDSRLLPMLEHMYNLREDGLKTVALTTNGLNLKRKSTIYRRMGLDSVNISLDTLKPSRFEQLTNRKGWKLVYDGLMSALDAKFDKLKLNCVVMKGFNEDELVDFVQLAKELPIEVRFIEFMPFAGNKWNMSGLFTYQQMLDVILKEFPNLKRQPSSSHEVSKLYKDESMVGSVGFISSITEDFCSGCNRLRLTTDGYLKVCLFGNEETSLRDLMRNGASDTEIVKAIMVALKRKKKKHADASILQRQTSRPMIKIARQFHSSGFNNSKNEEFTHLDSEGRASMVDVSPKDQMERIAVARGRIQVGKDVLKNIRFSAKGDILTVSKVAGILGAKLTSQLIPLCHSIPLEHVNIDINSCDTTSSFIVEATVRAYHKTGVEMESLMAVTVTLLTIHDMCKSVNKSMVITDIRVVSKVKKQLPSKNP